MYVLSVAILVRDASQATSSAPFASRPMSNIPLGIVAMMKKKVVPRIFPMTQEEIVQAPIIQQERITEQHDEMNVEVPIPMTQEEIVQEKSEWFKQVFLSDLQQVAEVPWPVTQEEIVHMPTNIQQESITQQVPTPMTPEEIVEVPNIIKSWSSIGFKSPMSPDKRLVYFQVHKTVLPPNMY